MTEELTVLVVDDQPPNLRLMDAMLTPRGHQVITAASGEEALTRLAETAVDLVLLDIMMPGIDGIEALQQFRLRWPDLPVIMLTAVANLDIARGALKRGAFDYVQKPFEWEHLERVVGAALMAGSLRGR